MIIGTTINAIKKNDKYIISNSLYSLTLNKESYSIYKLLNTKNKFKGCLRHPFLFKKM